ncbi:hypothetical protein D9M73_269560 [compost metagenome]
MEGLADFALHLLDLAGIHQLLGVEVGDDLQSFLGGRSIFDAFERLRSFFEAVRALTVRLRLGIQPGDGVASANCIESDVLAVVIGVDGLAIFDNCVLLAIHFNSLEFHFVSLGHPAYW